jgi:hypothetical protein
MNAGEQRSAIIVQKDVIFVAALTAKLVQHTNV